MPESAIEHVFATMVEEAHRGLKVPDFAEAVRERVAKAPPEAGLTAPSRRTGRVFRLGVFTAVAAVLVLTVLLVLNPGTEPLPREVIAGPEAVTETVNGDVRLKEGWAAALDHDGKLLVEDHTVHGGRFVIAHGDIPNQETREAMASWLTQSHPITKKELEMLKNTKHWLARGAVALCILGGTVYFDGQPVSAEEEVRHESPIEAKGHFVVTDVETAKAVPSNAASISVIDTIRADEVLASLGHVRGVKSLVLQEAGGFSEGGAKHVAGFTTLETIGFYDVKGLDDEALKPFGTLSNLREFQVVGAPRLTGIGFQALASLPVKVVSISDCEVFDDKGVAAIAGLSRVEQLVLRNVEKVSFKGLIAVQALPLTSLHLTNCPQVGRAEMQAVAGITGIRSLTLGGCVALTNDALSELAVLPGLEGLYIWDTGIGPGIAETLKTFPALKSVSVARVEIDEADVTALAEVIGLTNINVSGCAGVTDESLAAFAAKENLVILNISDCDNLTDAGVMQVAGWSNLRTLHAFDLANVSDAALEYVAKKNSRLTIHR